MDRRKTDTEKRALAKLFTCTSKSHDTNGPRLFAHFGQLLVSRMGLKPGDRVLDVGAGTGATLFPAVEAVGTAGHVMGVDLAPGMVDVLGTAIRKHGLSNAEAKVADADDLPFPAGAFDAAMCAFTLFFFPDPIHALGEIRRVLRKDGTLAISTFTKAGSASVDRIWAMISAHVQGPPPSKQPRFDDRAQLLHALEAAGFVDATIEESPFEVDMASFAVWMSWIRSWEFVDYLARMDADTLSHFRDSAAREWASQPGAPRIRFRMDAFLTRARKP